MPISSGARIGPYEIVAPIGAGGMGEVYRAKDPRLGRDVAIKVLPASFSADPDRLRRFEQEARAAGVLNHPNITAVLDVGEHEGAPYVVQELLEGETLRQALAGGRLPARKAIDYAIQIAHGLAAAHGKGIVHRDLKPENLVVTRDGRVKILDFGLARMTHAEEGVSGATNLPTATAGTEPGMVLGTLGYMSPEQVRGKPADARSDIFSFGAILYEMLAGQRAFKGDSAADTMSAILREDPPDISVTNQNVPPGLERIVRHCLEKSPEQRFHSAHDLAFDLEALSGTSAARPGTAGPDAVRAAVRFPRAWLAVSAASAIAAGILLGHLVWKPAKPASPSYRRLTFRRGNIGTARFAPDGRSVVYGASWEGQPIEIYTTRPEGPESTPLGVKNADLRSVSASGELAISLREHFLAGPAGVGTLATVPIGGGAPRSLAEFIEGADWTPDGKELAVARYLEGRYRLELPVGKLLYAAEHSLRAVRFSPRGDRIAMFERSPQGASLQTVDLAGKKTVLVKDGIRGQSLAWAASGEEIWFDDRGERGQFVINAVDRAGRVRTLVTLPVGMLVHDISRDGRVLVERYESQPGILGLMSGGERERSLSWFDGSSLAGLSDDGKTLLIDELGEATGRMGAYYLRQTDGSAAVKLGEGRAMDLSADGKWVLARVSGSARDLTLQPTGTGTPIVLDERGLERVTAALIFPDSKQLLIAGAETGKKPRLYVQDLASRTLRPITDRGYGLSERPISPDGGWVAAYGDWNEDMFLLPVRGGERGSIPGSRDLDLIRWAADGKFLFAAVTGSIPARLVRVEVATGRREAWKDLAPPELSGIIQVLPVFMTPDGKSYVYGYARSATSDLYLIEGLR
ncbi:MAG: protein kinase [Acidobacteriota bacterium]